MDEVQVDIVEPQLGQRKVERVQCRLRALVAVPELRRDEELAAIDAGGGQRSTDTLFVVVGLRRVDVPVADLERVDHDALRLCRLDLKYAEAELGNRGAVIENDGGNSHESIL